MTKTAKNEEVKIDIFWKTFNKILGKNVTYDD